MRLFLAFVLVLAFTSTSSYAQQSPVIDAPAQTDARTLALQVFTALTGGNTVTDASIVGTAARFAAFQQQTGTALLKVRGTRSSRIDLDFGTAERTEVRADVNGQPSGVWSNNRLAMHTMAEHNVRTDAAWFFPALSSLSMVGQPGISTTYLGTETYAGVQVDHLRLWQTSNSQSPLVTDLVQKLSTVDLYIDKTNSLPWAIAFSIHPENDASRNIPVEIRFGDYRSISGIKVPFRIQKLLNGTLAFDITVQTAVINGGIPDTTFSLN